MGRSRAAASPPPPESCQPRGEAGSPAEPPQHVARVSGGQIAAGSFRGGQGPRPSSQRGVVLKRSEGGLMHLGATLVPLSFRTWRFLLGKSLPVSRSRPGGRRRRRRRPPPLSPAFPRSCVNFRDEFKFLQAPPLPRGPGEIRWFSSPLPAQELRARSYMDCLQKRGVYSARATLRRQGLATARNSLNLQLRGTCSPGSWTGPQPGLSHFSFCSLAFLLTSCPDEGS